MNILPFTEDNLLSVLSNQYTSKDVIASKFHFLFFKDYLGDSIGLKAKRIVVEDKYISKDFLHDYASYYALCHEDYPKFCKRIHFFDNEFTEEEFKKIILSKKEDSQEFWKHYLGFIVVKPIPVTVIGYTVLKTYAGTNAFNSRHFWGVRNYKIHLFGNEVEISSLAFQEQDTVLAACATTAIWSMLNKASVDFHTILKSPSQITKDADNVSPDGGRLFPNKGLNLLQICHAILNSGLVSEVKQADYIEKDASGTITGYYVTNRYLKKILNAYSPIGIPLIIVIAVPDGDGYGFHAIAASGYNQNAPTLSAPKKEISWLSDNIEKFYAHDDQWGPFTKVQFMNGKEIGLETNWTNFHPDKKPTYTTNIIVPVYPKIRISYEDIEAIVLGLDAIMTLFFDNKIVADLTWDIKIDYSESFKSYVKSSIISEKDKTTILTKNLPKYIWIATCYIGTFKVFEFTFDATDVSNAVIIEDIICYLPPDVTKTLIQFLKNNKTLSQSFFKHRASADYYEFLINNIH